MSKFVECVDTIDNLHLSIGKGKIYEVIKESSGSYQIIDDSNEARYYSKYRFVTTDNPTELKSGNIIELLDGTRGLVVQGNGRMYVYFVNKHKDNHPFDKCSPIKFVQKIVKIYKGITENSSASGLLNIIYMRRDDLIWEAPKPKIKITKTEIAKQFNIDLEQLEIID